MRAITSRGSNGIRRSAGTMPISSSASNSGSVTGLGFGPNFCQFSRATMRRPIRIASSSSMCEVVSQTRYAGMHFGAAQRLVVGFLAGGHLHQRRTGQKDLRAFLDHHDVVGHPGDVGTARGGVAEHQRDGGDPGRRQPGQVAEHLPARDEDLFLRGQIGAAGFHQRNDRQPVLERDLVGPQNLSQGPRVAGAALDRRVVGDDQAFHAAHRADADDQCWHRPGRRCRRPPAGSAPGTARPRRRAVRCARGRSACRGRGGARRTWGRHRQALWRVRRRSPRAGTPRRMPRPCTRRPSGRVWTAADSFGPTLVSSLRSASSSARS